MRYILFALLMSALVGCAGANTPPPTPTLPIPLGEVNFILPQAGTVYYSEVMTLFGTASDIPPSGFILRVFGNENRLITQTTVVPVDGNWSVEIPITDITTPEFVTVQAFSTDTSILAPYSNQTTALLSLLNLRPDGVYGTIFLPEVDAVMGGEEIPVSGTASGLFEGTLLVRMVDENDTLVTEQVLTLSAPSPFDEVPFNVSLLTNGYSGPATIIIGYTSAENGEFIELDRVSLMLSIVAG
jgi:hypothetical protein